MEHEFEQEPHPDYIKGFNEGYLLTRHLPELAEQLTKSLPDNERGNGFKSGRNEQLMERSRERYPSWLTRDRDQDVEPGKDKSRNDRDIEKG